MMDDKQETPDSERAAVSTRTMEIVVALALLLLGSVVAIDSYRLGARWAEDGPQSGYFPFYIGLIICLSSTATLLQAVWGKAAAGNPAFVERAQLRQVISVLAPAVLYVLAIELVGIYVASAVYVAVFMVWLGKYTWFKSLIIGVAASAAFFVTFEVWFKVPLPKGMFDALSFLGY
jgi:Tripartite tricarboxylate transporter TctB family